MCNGCNCASTDPSKEMLGVAIILRPLDEVQLHGEVTLSRQQYDAVMTEVVGVTRRSKDSRKVFHFVAGHSVEQGVNTIHLDIMQRVLPRRERNPNVRRLDVSLAQEWFPSPSNQMVPPIEHSKKEAPRIVAILAALEQNSAASDLQCHIDWLFRESEGEPVIPLPFPIAPMLGADLNLQNVVGLHLGNEQTTRSARLDSLPNGSLAISVSFQLQGARFGPQSIEQAMAEGSKMLGELVNITPKEGDEHGVAED